MTVRGRHINQRTSNDAAIVIPFSKREGVAHAGEEDDNRLMERICDADHEAFAVLVRRHTKRFLGVASRFVQKRSDAEDIVQDAFLKLWQKPFLWQADRNTAFTTWFYRIIVNLCLDHVKKKRPLQLVDESWIEDDRMSQERTMLEREKQQLVEAQMAALPVRQRMALTLCFYEGLSNQEAAEAMGLHLKALQALLMRAKTTLKERLKSVMQT